MRRARSSSALAVFAAGIVLSPATAQDHDEAWVAGRVQEIRKRDVTSWTRIPWTASLLDARRASDAEQKPVFLFTLDGNMETGRC
jgi:hypothetical protein